MLVLLKAVQNFNSTSIDWVRSSEYKQLKLDDQAAWKKVTGSNRKVNYFVAPSGSLDSRLALHLHCSSFHCANNESESCFDISQPTLKNFQLRGIDPSNTLIFDHLGRRECHSSEAHFGIKQYPNTALQAHENFMFSVRKMMRTPVEMCVGAPVRERMRSILSLEPLELWGTYKGVTLWLEWKPQADDKRGRELERIILFAVHPSAFLWIPAKDPRVLLQETIIQVAAEIAQIPLKAVTINELKSSKHRQLDRSAEEGKKKLDYATRVDLVEMGLLKPAVLSYQSRTPRRPPSGSPKPAAKQGKKRPAPSGWKAGRKTGHGKLTAVEEQQDDEKEQDGEETSEEEMDLTQTLIRSQMDDEDDQERLGLEQVLIEDRQLSQEESEDLACLIVDGDFELYAGEGLDALPQPLYEFLQEQPGIRVDCKAPSNRKELEHIYRLLTPPPSERLDFTKLTLAELASEVLILYERKARRYKNGSLGHKKLEINDLVEWGKGDRAIVARRCSICRSRLLDDSFAQFKRADNEIYIAQRFPKGCGSDNCVSPGALGIPVNEKIPHTTAEISRLVRPTVNTGWFQHLIRSREDCEKSGIPSFIKTTCGKCREKNGGQGPIVVDRDPRWTINNPPVYIFRRPKVCPIHRDANGPFVPVDQSIPAMNDKNVITYWNLHVNTNGEPIDEAVAGFAKRKQRRAKGSAS